MTFSIVIFSSLPPSKLLPLISRVRTDLPDVNIKGVLYEHRPASLSKLQRAHRVMRRLRYPDFLRFLCHRVGQRFRAALESAVQHVLTTVHASGRTTDSQPLSVAQLADHCAQHRIAFRVTDDVHSVDSIRFVETCEADLGIIYGTRILKPVLFQTPRLGSINIHKHKLPEYRGAGAAGLWELRDGKREQTVTVHRVVEKVDAGAVLGERTFEIAPLDTLTSVGLKADMTGIDCLVEVIRAESEGRTVDVPQPSGGALYKGFEPHEIFAIERSIRRRRPRYRVQRGRPAAKLLARTVFLPAVHVRNRRRRRTRSFPVIILFHHVITDRPKHMGMPTDQFFRHVRFLKRNYRIRSLPEALNILKDGEAGEPTVVLTFDDGYGDNFLSLRAVAEAEHVPITLFVCTQHVSTGTPFRHDLQRGEMGFPPLTWDQIRYLARHNVTIGSHTRTHLDCGSSDVVALQREIVGSREDLRQALGQEVEFFAFPYGHPANMSAEALRIARRAYPYIFSAHGGINAGRWRPGSVIRRSGHPESLWELELQLQSLLEFERTVWPVRIATGSRDDRPVDDATRASGGTG